MTREAQHYAKRIDAALEKLRELPLHRLDSEPPLLKKAFDLSYDAGIFRLFEYDPALQEALKFELFTRLPALSGSLAFLGIQILAANKIMGSNNFPRQEEFFAKKCGIAVNHLRAPVTVVDAVDTKTGYLLNGTLTWASGYGIFDYLVIGFHHGENEMQAVVSFKEQPGMQIGKPAETFVGQSMNTVNIDLKDFPVAQADIVSVKPLGTYTKAKSISKTVHYAIYGLGVGALGMVKDDTLKTEATARLGAIKDAFIRSDSGEEMDALRIELFSLVQKLITTGMILNGGSSILSTQHLQQLYRELIMFNSNGLNDTLKGLFRDAFLCGE